VATRFGTDGIRGTANAELTPELVLALGRATARVLPADRFVVGRDTRRSGSMLQAALSAGIASEGADVVDLGVLPTPGVAWVSAAQNVPAAVISASHNPFADNGVKLFAPGGLKLPLEVEQAIEKELEGLLDAPGHGPLPVTGHGVGRLRSDHEAAAGYLDHLLGSIEGRSLTGLRIMLDCANGAASSVAPEAFGRAGAEVQAIGCEPDGANINDGCGSTAPERLALELAAWGADLGLALDGDADRLVAVDHTGYVASGDELLAIFARDMSSRGRLAGNTVVVTVMSNLGLRLALAELGVSVRETPVGDRNVLEALDAYGLALGGEQSGHLVFRNLATTGDGILTGLLLADLVARSGRSLRDLVEGAMQRVPQVLVNVEVPEPEMVLDDEMLQAELHSVEKELGAGGRVLLRCSGTEPLVRVMVEASDETEARIAAERLRDAVQAAASGGLLG
jgi:phosphoglucosamine mutase